MAFQCSKYICWLLWYFDYLDTLLLITRYIWRLIWYLNTSPFFMYSVYYLFDLEHYESFSPFFCYWQHLNLFIPFLCLVRGLSDLFFTLICLTSYMAYFVKRQWQNVFCWHLEALNSIAPAVFFVHLMLGRPVFIFAVLYRIVLYWRVWGS